jgi:hypothetical protein
LHLSAIVIGTTPSRQGRLMALVLEGHKFEDTWDGRCKELTEKVPEGISTTFYESSITPSQDQ